MSLIGTKRTIQPHPRLSAIEVTADIFRYWREMTRSRKTHSGSTLILRDAQLACTLTASLTEGDNQMSDQLFAAIRRGKVKPGMAAEFAKRVEAGALPVMKKMDGFKGYYLIAGVDDTIVAVSLFTNQTVAQSSTQKMMPWIKENLGPLLVTPTEPFDGTVLVSA